MTTWFSSRGVTVNSDRPVSHLDEFRNREFGEVIPVNTRSMGPTTYRPLMGMLQCYICYWVVIIVSA